MLDLLCFLYLAGECLFLLCFAVDCIVDCILFILMFHFVFLQAIVCLYSLFLKGSFTIFLFSVRTHILDSNEVWYS